MKTKEIVARLGQFVRQLTAAGVVDRAGYRAWGKKRANARAMRELFAYRRTAGMPRITALLAPSFDPQDGLVSLNYSPVAHNTLHAFPKGWTPVLRLCRGTVFDRTGRLVALAFPKFFNFGEHPDTTDLPDEPFDATVKYDGHLGIIFTAPNGQLRLATRQSFNGPSAKLGNKMLAKFSAKHGWNADRPGRDTVLLVEMIHPQTHVHVDYGRRRGFTLIGATNRKTLRDFTHDELVGLGRSLGLPVAERWTGDSIADLRRLMKDREVSNQEGYVVRFRSGLRVKFKFESYIGLMVQDKLSYGYLINRVIAGNLKQMLDTLPEEIRDDADRMVRNLNRAKRIRDEKKRRAYLYGLDKEREKNQHYRGQCRKFMVIIAF